MTMSNPECSMNALEGTFMTEAIVECFWSTNSLMASFKVQWNTDMFTVLQNNNIFHKHMLDLFNLYII